VSRKICLDTNMPFVKDPQHMYVDDPHVTSVSAASNESGGVMDWIKTNWMYVTAGAVVLIIIIILLVLKSKSMFSQAYPMY